MILFSAPVCSPPLPSPSLKAEVYQDFNPLKLKQSEGSKVIEFQTFDASLDEFYSKVSSALLYVHGKGMAWRGRMKFLI